MDANVPFANRPTRRMQKMLDRLEAMQGVHEDSLASVLNLVNPFPDYTPKRVGWPDMKAGSSVVLVDLYEQTLKQPAGMAVGDTWDLHVSMLPQVFSGPRQDFYTGSNWLKGPPQAQNLAPLNLQTWITGTASHDLLAGQAIVGQYAPGALAQGAPFRVIAQGLELVNTSADLYRGGTSYAYRINSPVGQTAPYTVSAPTAASVNAMRGLVDLVMQPPMDPTDVDDWPNTFIGDAREGVYVINTPTSSTNEAKCFAGRDVAYVTNPGSYTAYGTTGEGLGGHNGWNLAGAFMTGLAQGSSILVKHRVYLEIFPTTRSGDNSAALVRLSNPTVPYSPAIVEILAQVLRDMPAGCPYTENPLGEWFQSILDKVANLAPMIGGALAPITPMAPLIGSALGAGAGALRKVTSKKASVAKKK